MQSPWNRLEVSARQFSRLSDFRHSLHLSHIRRILPQIAIVAGIGLLVYVAAQYWTMYSEQRQLTREWETQQSLSSSLSEGKAIDDGLTRLSIPKINLNAVVVEGTSHRALLRGPGHIKNTPPPGDTGNSVLTGHRDTFFRHIYELNKGDLVTVQRNGKLFTYEVTGKKVVQPTDVSVLSPSQDSRLTLITCYPTYFIGPAPERLVVFTKIADTNTATIESGRGAATGKATAVMAH